jgi:hypothetical protein
VSGTAPSDRPARPADAGDRPTPLDLVGGSGQPLCYDAGVATRTLTWTKWLALVARHSLDNEFGNIAGYPSIDVAEKLGVSKQRVHQLIEDGVLDTVEVKNAAGRLAIVLITEASLERYLAQRVPDRNRQGYFAFPTP